jgi:hypothetical protein
VEWLTDLQNKRKWMRNVPGPDCLPIIGCLHKVPTDHKSKCGLSLESFLEIMQFLIDEMNKVVEKGGSVMRLWIGPKLIVVPLDAEATRVRSLSSLSNCYR